MNSPSSWYPSPGPCRRPRTLTYNPGLVPAAAALTYRLISSDGKAAASTTLDMSPLKMELFNGQNGPVVREANRHDIGAFTVANMNDTDAFGGPDHAQTNTGGIKSSNGGPGVNEMDLMQLRVHKPAGWNVNGDSLTVEVSAGTARFAVDRKATVRLGQTVTLTQADFKVAGVDVNFKDIWVEAHAASAARRDIELKLTYKENQPYTVKATAIWVTPSGFRATGAGYGPGTNDADDKIYLDHLGALAKRRNATDTDDEPTPGFTFGKPNMMLQPYHWYTVDGKSAGPDGYQVSLHNLVELEFTVAPANIGLESAVRFDVARTIEVQDWFQEPNQAARQGQFPAHAATRRCRTGSRSPTRLPRCRPTGGTSRPTGGGRTTTAAPSTRTARPRTTTCTPTTRPVSPFRRPWGRTTTRSTMTATWSPGPDSSTA
jgi:hypothetical protein